MPRPIYRIKGRDKKDPDAEVVTIPVMTTEDFPLRVRDNRPVSKRWPIPLHGQRVVETGLGIHKFCDRCHLPKPIDDFRLDQSTEDNLYGTCRSCEDGRAVYQNYELAGIVPPQAPHTYGEKFPTIVCLCGSTRFHRTFQEVNMQETLAGRIVLSIGAALYSDAEYFGHLPQQEMDRIKAELDELHLRKIDLADEVYILNVGGYVGPSTANELAYARTHGKAVRFLEPPDSPEQPAPWTPDQGEASHVS